MNGQIEQDEQEQALCCPLVFVAGHLCLPAIIDNGDDAKHVFTLLRDIEMVFGGEYPKLDMTAGKTLTGYYQTDAAGNVCLTTWEVGDITIPRSWVKIEKIQKG